MKTTHIILIAIIAAMVGIIIATAGDASQYVNVGQAFDLAKEGNSDKVHLIGELKRDDKKEVIGLNYQPSVDPNYMSFFIKDENNRECKVVCYKPPVSIQDFLKSEKIVVIGKIKEDYFLADQILMKCPSKYEDNQVEMER